MEESLAGAPPSEVWERLEPSSLSCLTATKVREVVEASVPAETLEGERVSRLAAWALKWPRERRKGQEDCAKAVLLYVKCET